VSLFQLLSKLALTAAQICFQINSISSPRGRKRLVKVCQSIHRLVAAWLSNATEKQYSWKIIKHCYNQANKCWRLTKVLKRFLDVVTTWLTNAEDYSGSWQRFTKDYQMLSQPAIRLMCNMWGSRTHEANCWGSWLPSLPAWCHRERCSSWVKLMTFWHCH
jgi:hypothetical protein